MVIHTLAPEVAAQIAAGEVVERPASVVKELVENSIDAGATSITVEAEEGGRRLIRVSDDGTGIDAQELSLAFAAHATSKLNRLDDLDNLVTLGFRGEALHSIGAVSTTEIVSRTATGNAAMVRVEASDLTENGSAARAVGTTVSVRGLFRPVPARFKFLRSIPAEQSRMQAVVTAYALANPAIRFALSFDGRESFYSNGSGDLLDVLRAAYGDNAAQLLPLRREAGHGGIAIDGFISSPALTRATREHIWLFVNGRWIQHRGIVSTIEAAYRSLLQVGRHPLVILRIQLPPAHVDVNVHPTKAEIRFQHEREVAGAVFNSIQAVLLAHPMSPEVVLSAEPASWPDAYSSDSSQEMPNVPVEDDRQPAQNGPAPSDQPTWSPPVGLAAPPRTVPFPRMPVLRVLGQVDRSYIISEGPEGLYMIDQHAAHERIVYDRLRAAQRDGATPQYLLEPAVVQLSADAFAAFRKQSQLLLNVGFIVEGFGGTSVLLRATPVGLSGEDPRAILVDILDEMVSEFRGGVTYAEAALWSVACRSAIKAGQQLSHEEMTELVRQLEATSSPQTCAHGRPTMIHVSVNQLERQFGRK